MGCCKFTAVVPSMRVTVTPWLWNCVAETYVRGTDFSAHIRAPETNAEECASLLMYMWYAASETQLRDPCDSVCCRMDAVSFLTDGRVVYYYVKQVQPRFLGYPNYHHQAVLCRACPCDGSGGGTPPDHPPDPPDPPDPPPHPPSGKALCATSLVVISDRSPSLGDTVTIDVTARNWLGVALPGVPVMVYYTGGGSGTTGGLTPNVPQNTDGSGNASWTLTQTVAQTDTIHVVLNSGTADEVDCGQGAVIWGGSAPVTTPYYPFWDVDIALIDGLTNGTCDECETLLSAAVAFIWPVGENRSEGMVVGSNGAAGTCMSRTPMWTMSLSGGIWTITCDGDTAIYSCPDSSFFDDGPFVADSIDFSLVSNTGKCGGWTPTLTLFRRAGP